MHVRKEGDQEESRRFEDPQESSSVHTKPSASKCMWESRSDKAAPPSSPGMKSMGRMIMIAVTRRNRA